MLTKKDFEQINKQMKIMFNDFWQDVLEPAFNNIHENFATKKDFQCLSNRLEKLEVRVSQLPTKSYIDDKFADFKREYFHKK